MRTLFTILFLWVASANAQDSAAGIKLRDSKTFQLGAIAASGMAVYAQYKGFNKMAVVSIVFAGALEVISITKYYQGCEFMIKPNGVTIKF